MPLISPGPRIAAHWHGALERRLRRAPLENLLLRNGLPYSSAVHLTRHIARAAILIAETAFRDVDVSRHPAEHQYWAFAQAICVLCEGIAALIHDPGSSRTAALLSVNEFLVPKMDWIAAALQAAAVVRVCDGWETRDAVSGLRRIKDALSAKAFSDEWVTAVARSIVIHASNPCYAPPNRCDLTNVPSQHGVAGTTSAKAFES